MKKYDIKEIGPIIQEAWIATFELACEHPEIVHFRETQLHIEFAHLLLTHLKADGYEPWKDIILAFDTPHFGFEGTGTVLWKTMYNDLNRPDIYLKSARAVDVDKPKVWIELKSQSNIIRQKDGTPVPKKSKMAYNEINTEEVNKYREFADCFDCRGFFIYAGMYYHKHWEEDSLENEMCEEFKNYNWDGQKKLDDGSTVSHFFKRIEASSLSFEDW